MANIEQDLQAIMDARYGKDVRQSIHDAISDINDVNEANISTVQTIADTAQGYANDALQAKTDAQTAQTGAETAQTHAETAEDGAEHFYQETLAIAQTLGSALIPRGTVEFANLPSVSSSDIKDGYMWNISDPFTTTSDFVEGAGLSIPMGANVYRITINNVPKWDILAGSSAQVYTGTEAQIEQAIQQGLLGEGVMINSLDDGEDELLTTSMIYHHNESLEDVVDEIESTLTKHTISVTADGVKTYSQLLNGLYSNVSALTNEEFLNSKLVLTDDSVFYNVFTPWAKRSNVISYSRSANSGTDATSCERVSIMSSGSINDNVLCKTDGTITRSDLSSTVATSGYTFKVIY